MKDRVLMDIADNIIALEERRDALCYKINCKGSLPHKAHFLRLYFLNKLELEQVKEDYVMIKECMKDES